MPDNSNEGQTSPLQNFSYVDEYSLKTLFNDGIWCAVSTENKEEQQVPALDPGEKTWLGWQLRELKGEILSLWLKNKDMRQFQKKYTISSHEMNEYIGYFGWEKLLHHAIDTLLQDQEEDRKNTYISTRFLSFIKRKNLWIEDLLKIIIILKNTVIGFFFHEDFKTVNQIAEIFDRISTDISKNYNDITIKLLNEYMNAIDNSNIISKTDIRGNILAVNEEFCRLSWFMRDELIGKPHNIVRHPDMSKEVFRELWETIQDKRIWKGVIKNRTKTGGSYWVKSTVVPILDEHNSIVEYVSIRTDITELKEAYKNLEEYTEALNETSMVLKLDAFGRIMHINDIFLRISCYSKEDLLGKSYIPGLISEDNSSEERRIPLIREETIREIHEYMQWHRMWKGVIKNRAKMGNFFWTSTNIVPIMNISDEIMEYVIIQSDVTDLEIAQQELKFSLEKQQELDTKKDEFLNIASHELRTPMTSIKWYLSMILDGDIGEVGPEVHTCLSQVYRSSERLLDLINDMLDISKIESGKQELSMVLTDIASLLEDMEMETRGLFSSKNQQFIPQRNIPDIKIETDPNKLKQVLLNLLGNANKFTPSWGTVELRCEKAAKELIIAISDSGIGIEKKDFGKIFEKFWQVKNSLTRDINGTGLWLPIAKAIIEQMGGYITVESEIRKGSAFSIHLPLKTK